MSLNGKTKRELILIIEQLEKDNLELIHLLAVANNMLRKKEAEQNGNDAE